MATPYLPDTNDELWRECVLWLTRWEMLRYDHKANWPQSSISDLASILRDGVLLCKLLNKIDPGCIDMKDVSLKPTMAQFLCLRNINLFLKTCKLNFGMKVDNLFEDVMLFDLTNFHKVLCTLSKLSRSEKALRTGIEGFSAQVERTAYEDEIYQKLKTDQPTEIRGSIIDNYTINSEDIYKDLLVVRSEFEQHQPKDKRDFVIKELLDTEKNYVDVLSKLKMSFMIPLQNQMNPDDHACVFHKIKELYDIHAPFLTELSKIRTNPNVKLSHIFLQFKDRFLIYGNYCANLTKATTLLQELCDQNEVFNQSVIRYESEVNNGKFKLRDVLSVPMQRILKYHLLLDRLIEKTDDTHDECADLPRAKESMLDVADYINEVARDAEHLNVINNLQDTIVEWEHDPEMRLSNYGKLIKDAELKIKAHRDQKTKNRYVFIFDKCILICKQSRGNQFAYRDILNIMEYRVEEIHNRPVLNNQARWMYNFLLVKNGDEMAYTIFVRTMELKNQIIGAINEALDNIQPKSLSHTNHNFELNTFPTPVQCGYCYKYLKGLIFQGYICNKCNVSVHKVCIQSSGKCGVVTRPPSIPNGISDRDPLRDKLWYVGEMDRNTSERKLRSRENGTFLVRIGKDSYALTLKTADTVKHMRILTTSDGPDDSKKYCLSQSKFFSSVEELVLNYENHSLKENFDRLEEHTKLLYPFHQLRAIVLRNFDAQDRCQLNVREGQVLSVIGKDGYREGFWKARTEDNKKSVAYHQCLPRYAGLEDSPNMAGYLPLSNDELWRECASWLTRCKVLRDDHKANWSDGSISDLANILRDGVLLCKLLKKLDHGCIEMKDVNFKPAGAQFLCLRNINLFLNICKIKFGIKEPDLFEDTMLFDLTHFHKVLCTLSDLSQSAKALKTGIMGFSAEVERSEEEDDVYHNIAANRSTASTNSVMDGVFEYYNVDSEDIYEDLLAVRSGFEVNIGRHGILPIHNTLPKSKRQHVINELLESEKGYVGVLDNLKMCYMVQLENHMDPADHACIFYKIEELHEIHSSFLDELDKIQTDPRVKLSAIIFQFKDRFLVYGSYGVNFPKARNRLIELCKQNNVLNEAVLRWESKVDNGKFKLKDILIVPMQRILRYHLLLESLIKEADKTHEEYECLCKAREAMLDVGDCINEEVRDTEHLLMLNILQDTIVDWEYGPDMRLSNYGRLIEDTDVKVRARTDPKPKNRHVFVFNKRILICKPLKGNQFAYRNILNILEYRILEINSLSFLLVQNDDETTYTIFVRTPKVKEEILTAINEALDKIKPTEFSNTKHQFKLKSFASPVECGCCTKYLKGLVCQGYICNRCYIAVHRACIEGSGKCKEFRRPINSPCYYDPLRDRIWYASEMDRKTSEKILCHRETGTFLIRIGHDSYVLSLKITDSVKHMRVRTYIRPGEITKYFLSNSRFFNSVEELVLNYENYSIQENFDDLDPDTKLLYPFRQLRGVVLRDSDSRDRCQLSVRQGETLTVIGKDGYRDGYWKGRTEDDLIGYFPASIIQLLGHVRFD